VRGAEGVWTRGARGVEEDEECCVRGGVWNARAQSVSVNGWYACRGRVRALGAGWKRGSVSARWSAWKCGVRGRVMGECEWVAIVPWESVGTWCAQVGRG
jgi:hypothetical protein